MIGASTPRNATKQWLSDSQRHFRLLQPVRAAGKRDGFGSRGAEPDDGGHESVQIAGVGSMIDDGGAYGELAVQQRGRWRGNARFLNVDDDLAIDLVGIGGAVA